MTNIPIDHMLSNFGITSKDAQQAARCALFQSGIIQKKPNRYNISCDKVERARQALVDRFFWRCNHGNCRREAAERITAKTLLPVEQRACQVCAGRPSAKALQDMAQIAHDAGKSRILIVGGTEKKEREILDKCSNLVQWRFIDGKKARDDRYYRSCRKWADIIIIWQSTPVDHRVSAHFDHNGDGRVITVRRRGIDCLASEISYHCQTK